MSCTYGCNIPSQQYSLFEPAVYLKMEMEPNLCRRCYRLVFYYYITTRLRTTLDVLQQQYNNKILPKTLALLELGDNPTMLTATLRFQLRPMRTIIVLLLLTGHQIMSGRKGLKNQWLKKVTSFKKHDSRNERDFWQVICLQTNSLIIGFGGF